MHKLNNLIKMKMHGYVNFAISRINYLLKRKKFLKQQILYIQFNQLIKINYKLKIYKMNKVINNTKKMEF